MSNKIPGDRLMSSVPDEFLSNVASKSGMITNDKIFL